MEPDGSKYGYTADGRPRWYRNSFEERLKEQRAKEAQEAAEAEAARLAEREAKIVERLSYMNWAAVPDPKRRAELEQHLREKFGAEFDAAKPARTPPQDSSPRQGQRQGQGSQQGQARGQGQRRGQRQGGYQAGYDEGYRRAQEEMRRQQAQGQGRGQSRGQGGQRGSQQAQQQWPWKPPKKIRPTDMSDPNFMETEIDPIPGPNALAKYGGEMLVKPCTSFKIEIPSRLRYNTLMNNNRLRDDMTLHMFIAVNERYKRPRQNRVEDPVDYRTERQLWLEQQEFIGREIREDPTVRNAIFNARMRNARWAQEKPEYARRLVECEKINDLAEILAGTIRKARREPGSVSKDAEKFAFLQFEEIATTGHLRGFSEVFLGSQKITVRNYEERFREAKMWPDQGHEYYQLKNYEQTRIRDGMALTPVQEDARKRALHMKDPRIPYSEPGPEPEDWRTAPQYSEGRVGDVAPRDGWGEVPQRGTPQQAPAQRPVQPNRNVNDMQMRPGGQPGASADYDVTD